MCLRSFLSGLVLVLIILGHVSFPFFSFLFFFFIYPFWDLLLISSLMGWVPYMCAHRHIRHILCISLDSTNGICTDICVSVLLFPYRNLDRSTWYHNHLSREMSCYNGDQPYPGIQFPSSSDSNPVKPRNKRGRISLAVCGPCWPRLTRCLLGSSSPVRHHCIYSWGSLRLAGIPSWPTSRCE